MVGGVALVMGLLPYFVGFGSAAARIMFLGMTALFILGAIDDRRPMSPTLRFAILFAIVLLVLQLSPEMAATQFVIGTFNKIVGIVGLLPWSILAFGVAVAMVGFIVSVNMADGVNGLATGMLLIWSGLFLVRVPAPMLTAAMLLFAALLVVWSFNVMGRLFMGDSGIYAAAGLIGFMIVSRVAAEPTSLPVDSVVVWAIIPVLDCLRLIATRSMAGKSPFMGDRNHLHHKLLQALPANQAVAVYLLAVGIPASLATILPRYDVAWFAFATIAFIVMVKLPSILSVFGPRRPRFGDNVIR